MLKAERKRFLEAHLLDSQNSMANRRTMVTSPASGTALHRSWQEKSAQRAYQQYKNSQLYQQGAHGQLSQSKANQDIYASPAATMPAGKSKRSEAAGVSPLQKIYGNGYLHRTGMVMHTSHLKSRKQRIIGSGGVYEAQNATVLTPGSVVLGSDKTFVP